VLHVHADHSGAADQAEAFIEGLNFGIAKQCDVVVGFQCVQKPPNQFGADASSAMGGQDLKERNVRHVAAVTKSIDKPDDRRTVACASLVRPTMEFEYSIILW
jgi:hypothetical protein